MDAEVRGEGEDVKEPLRAIPFDGQTFWCPKNTHLWQSLQRDGIHEPLILDYLDGAVTTEMVCGVVGAQFGYITLFLAKRAKRVVAFEPMRRYLRILRRNVRENGHGNVAVIPSPVFSGRVRGRMKEARFMEDSAGGLRSVTLDGKGVKFNLLAMHVEGASYEVLRGAKGLLEKQRPILVIAIHHNLLPRYGRTASELRGFLERRGYSIDIIPEPDYPEYWAAVPEGA